MKLGAQEKINRFIEYLDSITPPGAFVFSLTTFIIPEKNEPLVLKYWKIKPETSKKLKLMEEGENIEDIIAFEGADIQASDEIDIGLNLDEKLNLTNNFCNQIPLGEDSELDVMLSLENMVLDFLPENTLEMETQTSIFLDKTMLFDFHFNLNNFTANTNEPTVKNLAMKNRDKIIRKRNTI